MAGRTAARANRRRGSYAPARHRTGGPRPSERVHNQVRFGWQAEAPAPHYCLLLISSSLFFKYSSYSFFSADLSASCKYRSTYTYLRRTSSSSTRRVCGCGRRRPASAAPSAAEEVDSLGIADHQVAGHYRGIADADRYVDAGQRNVVDVTWMRMPVIERHVHFLNAFQIANGAIHHDSTVLVVFMM